ncbi:MAG: hypothetical protein ACREGE_02725 [Candidatus Microsaccharimonas sp.]
MHSEKKDRLEFQKGLEVAPETSYLIEDVEELINDRFDSFLENAPFRIKATDFHPELLSGEQKIGIDELGFTYLPPEPKEFTGIDLLMNFPLKDSGENPINIAIKWSNNTQVRLALVANRPILLAEESGDNGRTFHAEQLKPQVMSGYLESLGLPESFWQDDIKAITRDLYNCPDLTMTRSAKTRVDLASTLEIVHDARLVHDIDDTKQLVQELCINIDHEDKDTLVGPGEIHLSPQPIFRNMLRFERTLDDEAWKYAGTYRGKLGAGELYDELEQLDPHLGIPQSKVLDKALAVLTQVEKNS